MRPFSYNTAAELFPAAIRKKKRAGFAYRRFGTAAEAVRFAIEELPADSLNGAYLQVEEARFDQSGIRSLYESEAFPLPRRPRASAASRRRQAPTRPEIRVQRLKRTALGCITPGAVLCCAIGIFCASCASAAACPSSA